MDGEVCVVGAGGAGLAAAYALGRAGVPYRVFEARDGLGGTWRYGDGSPAYASLTSNTSRFRTSFRAMRMPLRPRAMLTHREFLAYLERFADRFALRERIETGARVERAQPRPDGGWEVTVAGREPERFDAVIAATGGLSRPRRAAVPGTFAGRQLHSAEYRTPDAFAGAHVVIGGLGTSAAEVAGDLAGTARTITMAGSTGLHVIPKHLARVVPLDLLETRMSVRLMPFSWRRRVVRAVATATVGPPGAFGLPAPDHRILDRPPVISDTFLRAMRRGLVDVYPPIERLAGDEVAFAAGLRRKADAVIWAIGYDAAFPYLPEPFAGGISERSVPLLRGVTDPAVPGLYVIGVAVAAGGLLPIFEAQAHWIAAHHLGRLTVPDPAAVRAAERRALERDFRVPDSAWRDRLRYIALLDREVERGVVRA